jgi:CO dehydrogenase/acetyl-CoA synthase delta subunit
MSSRTSPKRLGVPVAAVVQAERSGYPRTIDGSQIEAVRESWLVEDRWWAPAPVRRRYWEVVTRSGQNLVLFRDLRSGEWFRQAALA